MDRTCILNKYMFSYGRNIPVTEGIYTSTLKGIFTRKKRTSSQVYDGAIYLPYGEIYLPLSTRKVNIPSEGIYTCLQEGMISTHCVNQA